MASYYLAPSLVQLRSEINNRWPHRDKSSDGWIGDVSHSARVSDHNPSKDTGVVRALDIDKDGIDTEALLQTVIRDSRTNYVIWNGGIYQRIYGFARRNYTGSNKHTMHMHISIRHGGAYENNTAPWFGSAVQVDSALGAADKLGGLSRLDTATTPSFNPLVYMEDPMFLIRVGAAVNKSESGKVYLCRFGNKDEAVFKHISPAQFEALTRGGVPLRLVDGRDFSEHERNLLREAIIALRDSWKVY